ncbi:hypothetical protein [uncultured Jatrophihabitans sp.]|uniref:hypothetical protein n=1 Tax=uncultured Jatrophihabitans sp. TaxID=1610747 RepID=UPI0035CBB175
MLANAQTAQRSRRLAESIQRNLLTMRPARAGLEICARYRPAQIDSELGRGTTVTVELARSRK